MKVYCPIEQDTVDTKLACKGCQFLDGQKCSFASDIRTVGKAKRMGKRLLKKLPRRGGFPRKGGHTWKTPLIPEKWPQQVPADEEESFVSGTERSESVPPAEKGEERSETQEQELFGAEEKELNELADLVEKETTPEADVSPDKQSASPESAVPHVPPPQEPLTEPFPPVPGTEPVEQFPFEEDQPDVPGLGLPEGPPW